MINIEFLIISYIVSMFVDWIFQTQWQASHKSKWGKEDDKLASFIAITSHSIVYAILTTSITIRFMNNFSHSTLIFLVLFFTHIAIDTRIPFKFIMKLKGLTNEQINDYQSFGFMHIGVDHRLHEAVLLVLSLFA